MNLGRLIEFARRLLFGPRRDRQQAWYGLRMAAKGVDLRYASLSELGLSEEHCCWHANSGGPALRDVLSRLPISATDIAIDVGCGKGGAMITMSFFPFRRVDGVEISPHLAETARQNLRRLRVHNASVFCCDAGEFRKFDPYTFVYMFNPFPESVMAEVMNNLQDSLIHQPRLLTLVYFNPLYHSCVVENGFETVSEYTDAGHPFRIYRPSPPGRGPRGIGLGARTL